MGGILYAESVQAARSILEERKYQIVSVDEMVGFFARIEAFLAQVRPVSTLELGMSTRQFSVMLNAAVPFAQILQMLSSQLASAALQRAWSDVRDRVRQGDSLSRSLSRHPSIFNTMYVGMVKAGETSGRLHHCMEYLADSLENEAALKSKIQSALLYPAFVFVVCTLLGLGTVQYILPQFINGFLMNTGLVLPAPTRALIAVTNFLNAPLHWGGALGCSTLGLYMLVRYLRTPAGKFQLQRLLLHLPVLGETAAAALGARFCRNLGILIAAGVPMVRSLELSSMVLGNYVLHAYLESAIHSVKDGGKLSEGLREIPFFPPMVAAFAEVAEDTGRFPEMMDKLADMLEEDLQLTITASTNLIEPIMIAVVGGFMGFVMIALFLPLYQVMSNLG